MRFTILRPLPTPVAAIRFDPRIPFPTSFPWQRVFLIACAAAGLAFALFCTSCGTTKAPDPIDISCARMLEQSLTEAK